MSIRPIVNFHQADLQTEQAVEQVSRIIEMAWEDRTPFEAIKFQFGLSEAEVIALMRQCLHRKSFKIWRQRVRGRATKHLQLRPKGVIRAYCPTQYKHQR